MACSLYTLQREFCEISPLSGSDGSGKNDMPWLGELTQWAFTDEFFNTQVPPLSSRVSHWVWGCCKTNWQKSEIGRVFWCQLSFPWQVSLHLISTFLAKDITMKYYSACTSNICTFTLAANISSLCQMSCSTCAKFSKKKMLQPLWSGCHHCLLGWPTKFYARGSPVASQGICWLGIKVSWNAVWSFLTMLGEKNVLWSSSLNTKPMLRIEIQTNVTLRLACLLEKSPYMFCCFFFFSFYQKV